jgi:hypothetical protein
MPPERFATQRLGQEVRALIVRGHVDELDRLSGHHVTIPVVLDVNALGSLMMNRVLCNLTR